MSIRSLMFRGYFGWPSILALVPFVACDSVTRFGIADVHTLMSSVLPWTNSWNEFVWLVVGLLATWPFQFASLYKFAYVNGTELVLLEAMIKATKRGTAIPTRWGFLRSGCVILVAQFGGAMTLLPRFEGKAGTEFSEGIAMWACFQTLTIVTLCLLINYRLVASGRMPMLPPSTAR